MIPGGLDPKKMQAMMRQMGIKSEEIPATSVTIETDSEKIIIENPQVTKITMQGQESFQVSGSVRTEENKNEDLKMIMEQTGCTSEEAEAALEKTGGDIAQAILELSEKE
ncbi:nascent polypeptide-associated complex protein [Candidatus Micrarchaeota archaeon]|nr:nascent polypeptide-associated complex protein [Candidatus Micrarchaeota archaeon]